MHFYIDLPTQIHQQKQNINKTSIRNSFKVMDDANDESSFITDSPLYFNILQVGKHKQIVLEVLFFIVNPTWF